MTTFAIAGGTLGMLVAGIRLQDVETKEVSNVFTFTALLGLSFLLSTITVGIIPLINLFLICGRSPQTIEERIMMILGLETVEHAED